MRRKRPSVTLFTHPRCPSERVVVRTAAELASCYQRNHAEQRAKAQKLLAGHVRRRYQACRIRHNLSTNAWARERSYPGTAAVMSTQWSTKCTPGSDTPQDPTSPRQSGTKRRNAGQKPGLERGRRARQQQGPPKEVETEIPPGLARLSQWGLEKAGPALGKPDKVTPTLLRFCTAEGIRQVHQGLSVIRFRQAVGLMLQSHSKCRMLPYRHDPRVRTDLGSAVKLAQITPALPQFSGDRIIKILEWLVYNMGRPQPPHKGHPERTSSSGEKACTRARRYPSSYINPRATACNTEVHGDPKGPP